MCVCVGGGNNSTSLTSKDTAHRDKSNSIVIFSLTFYGSLNIRFPGRIMIPSIKDKRCTRFKSANMTNHFLDSLSLSLSLSLCLSLSLSAKAFEHTMYIDFAPLFKSFIPYSNVHRFFFVSKD